LTDDFAIVIFCFAKVTDSVTSIEKIKAVLLGSSFKSLITKKQVTRIVKQTGD
jgi:hypothetical protein